VATLVLGPLLRYAGDTTATVWVEVDAPCQVAVLGQTASSFQLDGHHYALVVLEGLEPGTETPYQVHLDGVQVWPVPDDERPPSLIRTRHGQPRLRLMFGSCRVGAPQRPPYTRPPSEHQLGYGVDALWAYSRRLQAGREQWPDGLMLLGDQVYADEVSPETADFIRSRRDVSRPPGQEVADFEEYTRLYQEAWSDPDIRWLLATVPVTMIFDDHDIRDDWNSSASWLAEIRRQPWWEDRIAGGLMAYWAYQHIGNLSPPELAEEPVLAAVRAADDGGSILRDHVLAGDRDSAGARWAYHRDFGGTRVLVIDSRAARVLDGDSHRQMIDDEEWRWISDHAHGDFDHLIIASTLPVFLSNGIHNLEAWNEAICAGAWGQLARRGGEALRRAIDLEHWPAFGRSFDLMVELLRDVAAGVDGRAPATILLIGGDVHHAYVADIKLRSAERLHSRVYQAVCSPFRNPLAPRPRAVMRLAATAPVGWAMRAMARAAGVEAPRARWRISCGPTFENSIGTFEAEERASRVTVWGSLPDDDSGPPLEPLFSKVLSAG
jgi:hypothetical protein